MPWSMPLPPMQPMREATDMGRMQDFDRRIRQGGDDAIAAVNEYTVGVEGWLKSFAALPNQVIPLWIPVSERLPEPYAWVLAWDGGPPIPYVCYVDPFGVWQSATDRTEHPRPALWMSIPEPPEVK